jgi:hypothetical protein
MNTLLSRSLASLALAGLLAGATVPAALADGAPAAPAAGEVIALENTPHLFVRDEAGVVHLAADPGALARAGQRVDWRNRQDVSVDELRRMTRGEPLLSMSLVKIGGAIYLPQVPADGSAPVLRLIDSVDTLTLLGISGDAYGRDVLDQPAWEARYGLQTSSLRTEDLTLDGTPAVGPAQPLPATQTETESATA